MPTLTTIEQGPPLPARALNRCGAFLDEVGIRRKSPSPSDLIEAAKRRCHLEDFGNGDFSEPLSRLLESCQRDARLNLIGKMALHFDTVRHLCNRLLMERDRRLDPDIGSQEIKRPIFIVGLPRSGTTLLHALLAVDPDNRTPLTWEVMSPSPPTRKHEAKRIRDAARSLFFLRWLAPSFECAHATGAKLPQECVSLMSPTFLSDQFDTMYNVPSYRAWFLKQDLRTAYEFHRYFLQHLQKRQPARRWILKAPAHLFAMPTLLSIYPDARFLQTHREPIEAITSVSSLITILRRVFSNAVDPAIVGRDALQYWSTTMTSFLAERDRLPADRICDLSYLQIRSDPIAAIEQFYDYFSWNLTGQTVDRMRARLASQPRRQNGFHRYEPSQFGLYPMEVAERFAAYRERFGLAEQRQNGRRSVSRSVAML
jgi:Sulfotransferase family